MLNAFFQTLLSVLIGFLLSSGVTFAIRDRIFSFLEAKVMEAVDRYLQDQVKQLLANPEGVARTFSPVIRALLAEALKDFERGNKSSTLNLFGFKIPAELAQLLMQKFLGGNSEKNINPFG